MDKACNKCAYLHPDIKGAKYYKCYCGNCPAKKKDKEAEEILEKKFRRLEATNKIEQLIKEIGDKDRLKAYWKREYTEECKREDEWVEKHQKLIKKILNISSEEEGSFENFLFKLYNQFEQLERQAKILKEDLEYWKQLYIVLKGKK